MLITTQWLADTSTLAYRCGGSTGITPVSRLTALLDTAQHLTKCMNYSENTMLQLFPDDDAYIEAAGLTGRGVGRYGVKRIRAYADAV